MTALTGIAYALVLSSVIGLLYAAWYASDVIRDRRLPWLAFAAVFLLPLAFVLVTLTLDVLPPEGTRGSLRATQGALQALVATAPFVAIVYLIARKSGAPKADA